MRFFLLRSSWSLSRSIQQWIPISLKLEELSSLTVTICAPQLASAEQ